MTVHPRNERKHSAGERERLLLANEKVARDNQALIFALREVHKILADRTSELTDEQRLFCAKSHVVLALAKYGTISLTAPRTTN